MPTYRTATTRNYQYFPGEIDAAGEPGITLTSGKFVIPQDYYSHPEKFGWPDIPTPWSFTEERRATLALYDYRGTDQSYIVCDSVGG